MLTRRRFFLSCATGLAALGVSPGLLFAKRNSQASSGDLLSGAPSQRTLEALVGQVIRFYDENWRAYDLVLDSVAAGRDDSMLSAFTVRFSSTSSHDLPSSIYAAWHRRTGVFEIHLCPRGMQDGISRYGAEYCLLKANVLSKVIASTPGT